MNLPVWRIRVEILVTFVSFYLLAGCNSLDSPDFFTDPSIRPGDDFHQYVNGSWRFDSTAYVEALNNEMQDDVYSNLRLRLDDSLTANSAPKIRDFYRSLTSDVRTVSSLDKELSRLDSFNRLEDLPAMVAWMIRRGYRAPYQFSMVEKDSGKITLLVEPGRAGFNKYFELDHAYYDSLEQIIARVLPVVGRSWESDRIDSVARIQRSLFRFNMTKDSSDLQMVMLPEVTQATIRAAQIPDSIQVYAEVPVVLELTDWINTISTESWKDYFTWVIIEENAHFHTTAVAEAYNSQIAPFTDKNISNYKSKTRAISMVNELMPDLLIQYYDYQKERKDAITQMAADIRASMADHIRARKELDSIQRYDLARSIDAISLGVAVPDDFYSFESLEIDPTDPLGNVRRAEEFDFNRRLSRREYTDDWYRETIDDVPRFVRAAHMIVLPISFSTVPLFSIAYDDAFNYGGLGFYVAHEIAHSFDYGSQWDSLLSNDVIQNRLVRQYAPYRTYEGYALNSTQTMNENFCDIVGLTAAFEAWQKRPSSNKTIDGYTGSQRFFMAFANSQREFYSDRRIRELIDSDEHAMSYLRVNGTVRNIDPFYEAFDVQPADSLYLSPEERIPIW